jgi:hypothetical protein
MFDGNIVQAGTTAPSPADVLTPVEAADMLAAVAAGGNDLPAVVHPLGFLCFPLVRAGDLGVCVHVWQPGLGPTVRTSDIHCHCWDLASTVLYGEVSNSVVPVENTDTAPTHRVFEVRSGPAADVVRGTARTVRTGPAAATTSRPGDTYRLPAGEFHRTDAADTATLVCGATVTGAVDLALGPIPLADHRQPRRHCAPMLTRRAAGAVAARIAGR